MIIKFTNDTSFCHIQWMVKRPSYLAHLHSNSKHFFKILASRLKFDLMIDIGYWIMTYSLEQITLHTLNFALDNRSCVTTHPHIDDGYINISDSNIQDQIGLTSFFFRMFLPAYLLHTYYLQIDISS